MVGWSVLATTAEQPVTANDRPNTQRIVRRDLQAPIAQAQEYIAAPQAPPDSPSLKGPTPED